MAKIHGISNCTRFLLDGLKPINGKKLSSFKEIVFFHDNFSSILSDTKNVVAKQQDDLISALTARENVLTNQINEDIARQRRDVEARIAHLHDRFETSETFFRKAGYYLEYLIAKVMSYKGIYPSDETVQELQRIRNRKDTTIRQKPFTIENAEKAVNEARWFLTFNTSFVIGAEGEERVIQLLSALSDDYHILNDVNFNDGHTETYQIDHIVVGPTGFFLLETKNWKTLDSEDQIQKLAQQVRRSNNALRKYLRGESEDIVPWIQSIVVSVNRNQSGLRISLYVDIITPDQLCWYIMERKKFLSEDKIDKLVRLIPCREAI
jgi:hypothetical protein